MPESISVEDIPLAASIARSERLGSSGIARLLWQFSLPAIVGMLSQALYNLIDRIFVGRAMGDDAIAGITVCFPFMLILIAFGMLIGFGGAALISIRLGEQKRAEAQQVLGNSAALLAIASLFVTAVGLVFLDPILSLLAASKNVLPYAHDYMQIILIGTIFQIVFFGLNAAIRAEGNPRQAMFSLLFGVATNIALAPFFIFPTDWKLLGTDISMPGFGWGMRGAALATVCAQAVSLAWVLSYFFGGKSLLKLRLAEMRLDLPLCRRILVIGSPPFALQFAACGVQAIMYHQLYRFGQLQHFGGDRAIAIIGVIYIFAMLILMPIFGLNQGVQPIIGYNYGAEKFDRVKRALLTANLFAVMGTLPGLALAMVFPTQIFRLFDPHNQEMALHGAHAMRISLMMLPAVGFQIISAGYFQAVGKPVMSMLLSISRQVLLYIPALLILPEIFKLEGVWAAMPASDACSAILTGTCLFLELRHLQKRHEEG
jgi:putative MATE family efflux protein